MGGGKSKEKVDNNTQVGPVEYTISGLRSGEVITIRGEPFAGEHKLFQVNFKHGDDIALHFKVVFLEAEGMFNKIKMNSRVGGKWGSEERKENVIYLNHHFELKFKCFEDKFAIEIDGEHFCDFKHRISPDKINLVKVEGDSVWKHNDVPNGVQQRAQDDDQVQFPTQEEVDQFIKGLRIKKPVLRAAPGEDEGEQLGKLIKEGLEVTKKLLGDDKGLWANITKIGGYLEKISSAGSAAFAFLKFIQGIGKDSDMDVIRKALEEICKDLKSIDRNIQEGFAKLTEHMDFIEFRKDVQNPIIAMFDLYIRCQTVKGSIPIEDFKKVCAEQKSSPRDILSRMFGFLLTDNNIIESHLKTKKYVYSVWEGWASVFFDYAMQLITMNMFYYGLILAENEDSGNTGILIDKAGEIKDLIEHIRRMRDRLQQIEESRMKTFHSEGYAKHFLREKFKSVKYDRGSSSDQFYPETLARIAFEMKRAWEGFNGPTDSYFLAVRGSATCRFVDYRGARWYISDKTKVTVVDNIEGSGSEKDEICLALIQPVTPEMRENNAKVRKEQKDKIKEAIDKIDDRTAMGQEKTLDKIKDYIRGVPIKPLLIMFNTDVGRISGVKREVQILPFNYQMTSEAWSCPGGPLPWKYYWGFSNSTNSYAKVAQIIVE